MLTEFNDVEDRVRFHLVLGFEQWIPLSAEHALLVHQDRSSKLEFGL